MSIQRRKTARGDVYDVRLRTQDRRVYTRTFRTKREADAFEARERADRSRGTWIDPRQGETSFDEWAHLWLSSNPAKRPSAFARDETIVRVHLVPSLGRRPLATITPRDVQALVLEWSQRSRPRTVRRQYGVLRAILTAAVEADLLVRTPCRGVRLPAVKQAPRPVSQPTTSPRSLRPSGRSLARWSTSVPSWDCDGASAPDSGSVASTFCAGCCQSSSNSLAALVASWCSARRSPRPAGGP